MDRSTPASTPVSRVPLQTMSNDKTTDALLGVYEEICKSHQAIDEFRMKLLGFLPLASLAGIFLLGKSQCFRRN